MYQLSKLILILLIMSSLTACFNQATKGGAIGAGTGATIGGIAGDKEGALLGGIVGGVAGHLIGKRMDEQATELREVTGVEEVAYDAEKQKIEAQMQILFDIDKTEIKAAEAKKLDELAAVFVKYPENIVIIEGHTDSIGENEYNQDLSERRAASIERYLAQKDLRISGLSSTGFGEKYPIASNETKAGRAKNRRVAIKISFDPERIPQK